ncbi:DUF4276 family protein [Hugenholtzia roseola]|uniref:DUF4276 family protein n=1 Tax=Hugenholtzia roseola TaxID=1002 RepID=UPI0004022E59|nr:DUF4276 family protein [Hugenholtzia roseola]
MKRLLVICEGETEQAFSAKTLRPFFEEKSIYLHAPLIKASAGGIVKWAVLKEQIERHLKEDKNVYLTTLIDYYGISAKHLFPQWAEAQSISNKSSRLDFLEQSMQADINLPLRNRFFPYLQLHEFEALLFSNIEVMKSQIPPQDLVGIKELETTNSDYPNPEMINDNQATTPSHRLKRIIRGYNKIVHGDIISDVIGLSRIREKCPRFNSWITKLENI